MLDTDRLDDLGVLITGGADGIGAALAAALIARGARVFLTDIAADKLAATADRLSASSAACDVSDGTAVAAIVEQAWDEIGPLDLLCANAGVFKTGSILNASQADIDWQFGVNVWGIVNACKPFVARLREAARPGAILMTGSENSLSNPSMLRGMPNHIYNMTKHCVLSLGDGLRAELEADSIAVSVLCPGPVTTGLGENSGTVRPERFGGAATFGVEPGGSISEDDVRRLQESYISADRVAEIALEGIRRGLFVIPTHDYVLEDATLRFRDIERGFEVLR